MIVNRKTLGVQEQTPRGVAYGSVFDSPKTTISKLKIKILMAELFQNGLLLFFCMSKILERYYFYRN